MKERILFGSVPLAGHLAPMLPLARQLLEEGHEVACACHPLARESVKREGVPFIESFGWGKEAVDIMLRKATDGHIYRTLFSEKKLRAGLYLLVNELEQGVKDFLKLLDEWKPDACVLDILFFPGIIAAEIRGIPYASSCPVPIPIKSRDLLPYSFGFPSTKKTMNLAERMMNGMSEAYWGLSTRYLNRVRASYSLPPITHLTAGSFSPYLYLCYTTDQYEFARSDLPPQVHFIGPARALATSVGGDTFDWAKLGKGPLVYFTMGTLQGDRKLIGKMIEAGRGAPWRTVITLGRLFKPDSFANVPPEVTLLEWVPQTPLLKRVSAMVCHGAFNTVNDALCESIPLVVVPLAWDHLEVAQRVVESGVGVRLSPRTVTPAQLRAAVEKVLSEPSYKANARRLADNFNRCQSGPTGASLIRKLARTRKPVLRAPGENPTLYAPVAI